MRTPQHILLTLYTACALLISEISPVTADDKGEGDPAALKVMHEAHESRARWRGFTGFAAHLTVNQNGREASGTVEVDAQGSVQVSLRDLAAKAWAGEVLESMVEHRLERADSRHKRGPISWGESEGKHPFGRLLKVNDPLRSEFRVRDGQVVQVNRTKPDGTRFSINVTETTKTTDGKFLPKHFTVFYFDKSNALTRVESTADGYTRVGSLDLPRSRRIVTAKDGQVTVASLTLSEHRVPVTTAAK